MNLVRYGFGQNVVGYSEINTTFSGSDEIMLGDTDWPSTVTAWVWILLGLVGQVGSDVAGHFCQHSSTLFI